MRKFIFDGPQKKIISAIETEQVKISWYRVNSIRIVFLAMIALIVVKLVLLQVVEGREYRQRSDNNRITLRTLPAARGIITDKNGNPLVINVPVAKVISDNQGHLLPEPQIISREESLALEATASARLIYDSGRYYPFGSHTAHLIGYVAQASEAELSDKVKLGDLIGKAGVERNYQDYLSGLAGQEVIELNAKGEIINRSVQQPAIPGQAVKLHLDIGLQQELSRLMNDRAGAAVVTDPSTGAVMALVSTPSYDPNLFSRGVVLSSQTKEEIGYKPGKMTLSQLLNNPDQLLVDRVITGTYPPGSVYKVVPSVAGLEEKVLDRYTTIEDEGVINIDQFQYRNWYYTQYGRTEGLVDVVKALQRSNDIYYYRLGEMLGPERLASWSQTFGFGKLTGIDLPGEKPGLVPTPVWKERVKGERWFLGNTYHYAIGQGDLLVTPIQLHQMMGVIATRGLLCVPKVVSSLGDKQTGVECTHLEISQENLEVVNEGLVAACSPGGTGVPFFNFDLASYGEAYQNRSRVACKTGTAQYNQAEGKTHALFSVYSPSIDPEIMVTVVLEGAGEGSKEAAPVAYELLKWWYENKD